MSLRKSPQLTPALLAATRNNVQHSTRPRNPAASRRWPVSPSMRTLAGFLGEFLENCP